MVSEMYHYFSVSFILNNFFVFLFFCFFVFLFFCFFVLVHSISGMC